ncbi:MAG: type IV toxin-antitoxin system AbiEi family antitoxin domain-containing protein [Thermomicrobiales bacterium]
MTNSEAIIDLARQTGFVTTRAVRARGIAPYALQRLTERGTLERVARGVYVLVDTPPITEHVTLIEACLRVPTGVICLLSALRFHGLTTQLPHAIWMAIDRKAWLPNVEYPPLRIVRFSGTARTTGIEEHIVSGETIRVYSIAKTVADCFKYRNTVGLDVAIEALADAWRGRRTTMDALWQAAKVDRVAAVMRPYLESVAA